MRNGSTRASYPRSWFRGADRNVNAGPNAATCSAVIHDLDYLRCFRPCFVRNNTFAHLGTYCRGLLSDLARKSVEPIALAAGSAVRTLQEFLTHHVWDHDGLLTQLQRRIVAQHLPAPSDSSGTVDELGVIGLIDETSVPKKGDKTPGALL